MEDQLCLNVYLPVGMTPFWTSIADSEVALEEADLVWNLLLGVFIEVNYYLRANNIKQDDPVRNRCVVYLRIGQFLRQRPASASEGRPLSGLDPTTHASLALKDARHQWGGFEVSEVVVQLGEEGNTAHKRIRKMLPQNALGSIFMSDSLNKRQCELQSAA
ncbi:hypothetical protein Tco_1059536 [Tanacetum coccineum]